MNSYDYINLFCIFVWCAVIFGQGVLLGLSWAASDSHTEREDKHNADNDTTPPPTIPA